MLKKNKGINASLAKTLKSIANGAGASILISVISFISFVILPSYASYTSDFKIFGEANIYSGFYNSSIAVAAGSVALLTLHSKNKSFARLYFLISFLIIVPCLIWSDWRESELIVAYAVLSVQGYVITSQRYLLDKVSTAYKLSFHPIIFMLCVSLQESFGVSLPWTSIYLYCAVFSVILWRYELCMTIRKTMAFKNNLDLKRLGYLLLSCAALPFLVQMDLPFLKYHELDIAYFSIVHKIVYSIPVALTAINLPLIVNVYEKGTRRDFLMIAIIISSAVLFLVIATLVGLNVFTDIYFDRVLIMSIVFISVTYAFLNLMLSIAAIVTSRISLYVTLVIIMIASLGYFFQSFGFYIIYKGAIFLVASIVMVRYFVLLRIFQQTNDINSP